MSRRILIAVAATLTALGALGVLHSPAASGKAANPPSNFELPKCIGPCAKYYTPKAEAFLRCAGWRESSFGWSSDSRYGSGAFQIIKSTSSHYAKKLGLDYYADHRAYLWPKAVQTHVAYAMVNPKPEKPGLEGKFHWDPKWATTVGASTYSCENR